MGRKILVIDDDPAMTKLIAHILSGEGYRCITANDARVGFDLFEKLSPDLCVIDFMMPRIDGYSMCKKIKNSPKGEKTPVIMVSAVIRSGLNRSRMQKDVGADGFLYKPFRQKELVDAVKAALTPSSPEKPL